MSAVDYTNKIPPRSEWKEMSISQLFEVKNKVSDTYYNMRSVNASFANQYLKVLNELDALIQKRETDAADQS
jgi:hypothetical protein